MRVRQLSILLPAIMLFSIGSFAADTPSPSSGKQLYQSYCGSCHGADAKGSGPVASSLKTAPTNLTLLQEQQWQVPGDACDPFHRRGKPGWSAWLKSDAGVGTALPPHHGKPCRSSVAD